MVRSRPRRATIAQVIKLDADQCAAEDELALNEAGLVRLVKARKDPIPYCHEP